MRIAYRFTPALAWASLACSALSISLDWIGRATILLETPPWLKDTVGFVFDHWYPIALLLATAGALLLILNERRRMNLQHRQSHAHAILLYAFRCMKPIETAIDLYMHTWLQIEARIHDVNFHWKDEGDQWTESVGCLNAAYDDFAVSAENLFFTKPVLPPVQSVVPPEISHVRPDIIRQQYKQLWLEHRRRIAAINSFRQRWNNILFEANETLRGEVRSAAELNWQEPFAMTARNFAAFSKVMGRDRPKEA